jgi:valyl-tRNA synthetase
MSLFNKQEKMPKNINSMEKDKNKTEKESERTEKEKERYNPLLREKYWQNFWEKEGVYRFNPESEKPLYTIDTPPPTISGSLHLGHIYSYTQAEIIARFRRMNGFNVRYPFGMDNDGLPTERLVEKEKGVRGREMNLEDFVNICLQVTEKYQKEYENLWKSIGLSVDWRLEYSTISPEVQKLSQSVFRELYKKGLIYKKNAPALYCCECQTAFAQAEKEDKEKDSVFYDLAFKTEKGQELIISTTRPELLPACVAVFVHPDDDRYKNIIGQRIVTPLGEAVEIMADEKVDPEKGSGVVMCCTYGDETDVYWAKKYNLPEKIIIEKDGKFKSTPIFDQFHDSDVEKSRRIIVEELKKRNAVLSEKNIKHSVGVHERCGTPIEFLPTIQWFVKLCDMKDQLIKAGNKINWRPDHMKKRFEEWINGLKWDWCISRERFYGIPIPVFNCSNCDYIHIPEEDKLPIDPKFLSQEMECPECHNGKLIPEKNVLDTWFTSALTPEINNQNKLNGKLRNKMFPMSMRPQAHDIIRTWTLYTILMSLYRYNKVPWDDLMISGHLLVKKGEKISKKTGGDKYKPEELIKEYSADAMRYAVSGASLGRDAYFDKQEVDKGKKLVTKIYNAGRLALSNLHDFDPKISLSPSNLEGIDKWIIDRSFEVGDKMAEDFNNYDFTSARISFEDFFWREYCDNYLEIIKSRLYGLKSTENPEKRLSAQYACYQSFLNVLKMASPFVPHITEEMFHISTTEKTTEEGKKIILESKSENGYFSENEKMKSIHITNWPRKTKDLSNESIKIGADLSLRIIAEIRKYKSLRKMRLNQPIQLVTIICDKGKKKNLEPFLDDITSTLRIEKIRATNKDDVESKESVVIRL